MTDTHELLTGANRCRRVALSTPWVTTTLAGGTPIDAAANEVLLAGLDVIAAGRRAHRRYGASLVAWRGACIGRSRSTVLPRTRARGAGRPGGRRSVRSAARSGSSGDDGSGLAGGEDPPGPRSAVPASRTGVVR